MTFLRRLLKRFLRRGLPPPQARILTRWSR